MANTVKMTFCAGTLAASRGGVLVDVGAADGVTHSNTRMLITEFGWRGCFSEPMRAAFRSGLCQNYHGINAKVVCARVAIGLEPRMNALLHVSGQVSTLHRFWRERAEKHAGAVYDEAGEFVTVELLESLVRRSWPPETEIDFMSVDAEGSDTEVLQSMDLAQQQQGAAHLP